MSEVLVVGSGPGGATVAKELALRGKKVTIVERGHYHELGTERSAAGFYLIQKSTEGTEIYRALMVGGTSVVALANGVRSLQRELAALGIDLEMEFAEAENELNIAPVPERLLGERTRKIMAASKELGYNVRPMPKFIDFSKCRGCGTCVLGCRYGAKWSAQQYIGEALKAGAKLLTDTTVNTVLHTGSETKGVSVRGPSGNSEIEAENVVLAAGGMGTPVILQRSGLNNAGTNFFSDLVVDTYGIVKGDGMRDEMGMAALIDEFFESDGFILSPVLGTSQRAARALPTLKKHLIFAGDRILGILTKIKDDDAGRIDADGTVHKPVTENDRRKLDKGDEISRNILSQAGADPKSLWTTKVTSGHPGGTVGVGRVVNVNLETEISRLFVADASVFPQAPGLPPVLTIVALAKRLAKRLTSEYI